MSPDAVLDRVIGNIADGAAVDWNLLDADSRSDADREWAKALRILHDVANLHRTTDDQAQAARESTATQGADTPAVLEIGRAHV